MPFTAQFGSSATSTEGRRPGNHPLGRCGLLILGTGGNALDLLDAVMALNAQGANWDVLGSPKISQRDREESMMANDIAIIPITQFLDKVVRKRLNTGSRDE